MNHNDIAKELEALRKEMKDKKWSDQWGWKSYGAPFVRPPIPIPPRSPHAPYVPLVPDEDRNEDDLYKIGYMDGKMGEPEDVRYKDQESYQMGYKDGQGDVT